MTHAVVDRIVFNQSARPRRCAQFEHIDSPIAKHTMSGWWGAGILPLIGGSGERSAAAMRRASQVAQCMTLIYRLRVKKSFAVSAVL